jgi:hypothetical protein
VRQINFVGLFWSFLLFFSGQNASLQEWIHQKMGDEVIGLEGESLWTFLFEDGERRSFFFLVSVFFSFFLQGRGLRH